MDISEIKRLRSEWETRDVRISPLTGGITNILYLVEDSGQYYKVRIPGEKTNTYLDRDAEIYNVNALQRTGVVPGVVDYKKDSKISIFWYIPGRTGHKEAFKDPRAREETVASIKQIHESNTSLCTKFDTFHEIQRFLDLSKTYGDDILRDYPISRLVERTRRLEGEIAKDQVKLVPCHNDLLPENIIFADHKAYVIDWEYGGMNDPCFDIADFIVELDPVLNPDEEKHILDLYFEKGKDRDRRRVDFYKFLCDFCWSLWAVTQYHVSLLDFDFDVYSRARLNRTLRFEKMIQEKYVNIF
jgi:thiamine kinase-like enzyme